MPLREVGVGRGKRIERLADSLRPAVSFPSTGGMDVSLHTLGPAVLLARSEERRDTAAAAIGIPPGRGGRKLFINYRCDGESEAAGGNLSSQAVMDRG